MRSVAPVMSAAILALSASAAQAADWWLVPGGPGDRVAQFADAATLVRSDDVVGLSVLRIDRAGRSSEAFQHVDCRAHGGWRGAEALRRFACASDRDRDHFGLILASQSPAEVARMVLGSDSDEEPQPIRP